MRKSLTFRECKQLSFWAIRVWLTFRDFFVWFTVWDDWLTIPLGCSDCSPSCPLQNDNNLFVIKNWKCNAQDSHLKMKIISIFERYFFAQKKSNLEWIISRKKALKTLIISKWKPISIVFFLLNIRKWESSLNLMCF